MTFLAHFLRTFQDRAPEQVTFLSRRGFLPAGCAPHYDDSCPRCCGGCSLCRDEREPPCEYDEDDPTEQLGPAPRYARARLPGGRWGSGGRRPGR